MRTLLLLAVVVQSGCYSEDWIIIDQRGLGSTRFWARVATERGEALTFVDQYPLSATGRTQFNISSGLPIAELKNLQVTAWADADGTRECLENCEPLDGDPVVTLSGRNWPFVYEITFPASP